jgi:hypothetical protein
VATFDTALTQHTTVTRQLQSVSLQSVSLQSVSLQVACRQAWDGWYQNWSGEFIHGLQIWLVGASDGEFVETPAMRRRCWPQSRRAWAKCPSIVPRSEQCRPVLMPRASDWPKRVHHWLTPAAGSLMSITPTRSQKNRPRKCNCGCPRLSLLTSQLILRLRCISPFDFS